MGLFAVCYFVGDVGLVVDFLYFVLIVCVAVINCFGVFVAGVVGLSVVFCLIPGEVLAVALVVGA